MMTIVMIDVEAGKEDLFDRLYTNLNEMKDTNAIDKIQIMYLAKCYTHSDISLLINVKDSAALSPFIVNILLQMEGVWDIQIIPLLSPNFFNIPKDLDSSKYNRYTVTLDIRSDKTKQVYKQLKELAAFQANPITFIAYSFFSYENDILLSFLSSNISTAGKFVEEKIRKIEGVIDTYLWQIEKWKFITSDEEWLNYIKSLQTEDPLDLDEVERSFKKIMDSYICAI